VADGPDPVLVAEQLLRARRLVHLAVIAVIVMAVVVVVYLQI